MEGLKQLKWKIIFSSQETQLNSTFPALHTLLNQKDYLEKKQQNKTNKQTNITSGL